VTPKKHLGQHFLIDQGIAKQIVDTLSVTETPRPVLEIGPGTGVLTQYLLTRQDLVLTAMDIDKESIVYLKEHFPDLDENIVEADFLQTDLSKFAEGKFAIIGNFPYNISSQIFFKVLENRDQITEIVGMLQKEVAERLASPPGSRDYGILSVLLQAFYTVEYCFSVPPHVFNPPPKVNSGVIRVVRNDVQKLDCDEVLFKRVVKQAFSTRRKTLRNALKPMGLTDEFLAQPILDKRAEQLSVQDFIGLTQQIEHSRK
ncbi:MAG: 16S rRNA (adenine(1518)-N(6)/adenine(1519)-N(6))-dimethyltransferase RsmA, partial [Sphingobacteriales bacterium]